MWIAKANVSRAWVANELGVIAGWQKENKSGDLDVRLQVFNGEATIHYGDAGGDTYHHGVWGAGEVAPRMSKRELTGVAQDLMDQAADMEAQ